MDQITRLESRVKRVGPMSFTPTGYELVSPSGTRRTDEGGWTLVFADEPPALIRADYASRKLRLRDNLGGLYRYADWLPLKRVLKNSAGPSTFRSQGLARELGLKNLWITFNGWWPERDARMKSGSFKECEAYSVCGRMGDDFDKILVVASAGNTARAFARVCSDNGIPLLLFVPEDNLDALWFDEPPADCVKLIAAEAGGDYFDAIRMSGEAVAGSELFAAEGGAGNVARRDGMGTTVLSAAVAIGRIPDAYFQAVGSGTGAIAAWEAAMRLRADGGYGDHRMRLMVSQNVPFVPMADSWAADSRELISPDDGEGRRLAAEVSARVLTNRRPPWGIAGGLYDAMKNSGGDVLVSTNEEARIAGERFEELEGCDISPAAAVAVASLFRAAASGAVGTDETVMLNITGGGMERFRREKQICKLEPSTVLKLDADRGEIVRAAEELFRP